MCDKKNTVGHRLLGPPQNDAGHCFPLILHLGILNDILSAAFANVVPHNSPLQSLTCDNAPTKATNYFVCVNSHISILFGWLPVNVHLKLAMRLWCFHTTRPPWVFFLFLRLNPAPHLKRPPDFASYIPPLVPSLFSPTPVYSADVFELLCQKTMIVCLNHSSVATFRISSDTCASYSKPRPRILLMM